MHPDGSFGPYNGLFSIRDVYRRIFIRSVPMTRTVAGAPRTRDASLNKKLCDFAKVVYGIDFSAALIPDAGTRRMDRSVCGATSSTYV